MKRSVFTISNTHRTPPDSTISCKNLLRNAARNAFEKRLTKERTKSLAGSTLGGNCLKMCPKRLPVEHPSRFIFGTFSKKNRYDGLLGFQARPGATRRPQNVAPGIKKRLRQESKSTPEGQKAVPAGAKIQPSSNQPRHPDSKSAKNPASPHSTQISKNIEVRRCRVRVLNIYIYIYIYIYMPAMYPA